MQYCVIRNTTKIIDGSDNSIFVMAENAKNAGFAVDEVEILTEEQYQARKELEPRPTELPSGSERIEMLENMLLMIMEG